MYVLNNDLFHLDDEKQTGLVHNFYKQDDIFQICNRNIGIGPYHDSDWHYIHWDTRNHVADTCTKKPSRGRKTAVRKKNIQEKNECPLQMCQGDNYVAKMLDLSSLEKCWDH